jgi:paired amphipathic helix protein Sin3a
VSDRTVKENSAKNYESGSIKKSSMKNTFEETLFKVEDERFELDISVERFKAAIKWLNLILANQNVEDKVKHYVDKIKKFNVVEIIYGLKNDEILRGIETHSESVIPVVLKRIQEKLEVLKDSKARYESDQWAQSLEASFHRSLDLKSCSIKHYDKKVVLNKRRQFLSSRLHHRPRAPRPYSAPPCTLPQEPADPVHW